MANPNWGVEVIPEALNWENFKLTFYGTQVIKFTSFTFEEKSDIAVTIGMGGLPVSWSKKKVEFDAKATLHIDEMKFLTTLAVTFGGMVTMLPPAPLTAECQVGSSNFSLIIPAVKIKSAKYEFKQGDDKTEVPLDLVVLGFPRITML